MDLRSLLSEKNTGHTRTIANQIRFGTILLVVASVLITASCIIWLVVRSGRDRQIVYQHQVAQNIAAQIDANVDKLFLSLDSLADLRGFLSLPADTQTRLLDSTLRHHQAMENLFLLDADGTVRYQAAPARKTDITGFADALKAAIRGEDYLGPVQFDSASHQPWLFMAVPVVDAHQNVDGALIARVNFDFLWYLLFRIQAADDCNVYILDEKNQVIIQRKPSTGPEQSLTNGPRKWKPVSKQQMDGVYEGIEGVPVIGALDSARQGTWKVIVELPVRSAFLHIQSIIFAAAGSLVAFIIVALMVAFAFARQILRPLRQLTETAARISTGDFSAKTEILSANEFGFMGKTFNVMTERLMGLIEAKQNQAEFLKMVFSIAAKFIQVEPGKLTDQLQEALGTIGRFLAVDRVSIYECGNDGVYYLASRWADPAIPHDPSIYLSISPYDYPHLLESLSSGQAAVLTRARFEAGTHEAAFFELHNVKALVTIPMVMGDSLTSFLALTELSATRTWREEELTLIRLLGEVLAVAQARRDVEVALQQSEARLRLITEHMLDVVFQLDTHGIIGYASPSVKAMVGIEPDQLIGAPVFDLLHKDDLERVTGVFPDIIANPRIHRFEARTFNAQGQIIWIEVVLNPIIGPDGTFMGLITASREITDRIRAEQELRDTNQELEATLEELRAIEDELRYQLEHLQQKENMIRESERRFRTVLEKVELLALQLDNQGNITFCNQYSLQLTGWDKHEIIGKSFLDVVSPPELLGEFSRVVEQESIASHGMHEILTKSGERRLVHWNSTVLLDSDGVREGIAFIAEDVTERQLMEDRLTHLSLHDTLTGLYNRTYFEEEMKRLENSRFTSIGFIMCDVDGLKLVNDTLGHDAGDALLISAARVIKNCFREGDVVSRVGGDEFAILLPESTRSIVEEAVQRLKRSVEQFNASPSTTPLSLSIGLAVRTNPRLSMIDLYKEADNNMYREKLHSSESARSAIVQTLMKALEARDFNTEGHTDRMQHLAVHLGRALRLDDRTINDLRLLARFHDIGKVGIPDRILFKPGPLTHDEVSIMRRHCEIGHRIALSSPDLVPIADLILKHHEWWNGMGYPLGLAEREIPLECQILSIVDAYDAMTSDRPYRQALPRSEAVFELRRCAGSQFNPQLVETFITCLNPE